MGSSAGRTAGQDLVHHRRAMADIEVERVERRAQVQLRIIVEPGAAEALVAVRHRPSHHVAEGIMVEVEVEGAAVVEAEILREDVVALDHAQAEGDGAPVLRPHEVAHLVGHLLAELAEELRGELLEAPLRAREYLGVERIDLGDALADVARHRERDRGCRRGGAELEAQVPPRFTRQRISHVGLEGGIVDVEPRHRVARHAGVAVVGEAAEHAAVSSPEIP